MSREDGVLCFTSTLMIRWTELVTDRTPPLIVVKVAEMVRCFCCAMQFQTQSCNAAQLIDIYRRKRPAVEYKPNCSTHDI